MRESQCCWLTQLMIGCPQVPKLGSARFLAFPPLCVGPLGSEPPHQKASDQHVLSNCSPVVLIRALFTEYSFTLFFSFFPQLCIFVLRTLLTFLANEIVLCYPLRLFRGLRSRDLTQSPYTSTLGAQLSCKVAAAPYTLAQIQERIVLSQARRQAFSVN